MLCSRSAPLLKNLCWQKNAAGTKPELPPSSAVPSSKEAQGLGRKSAFPCPSEKANLLRGDGDRLPAHHPDALVQSGCRLVLRLDEPHTPVHQIGNLAAP